MHEDVGTLGPCDRMCSWIFAGLALVALIRNNLNISGRLVAEVVGFVHESGL